VLGTRFLAALVWVLIAVSVGAGAVAEISMGEAVAFPHAGIALAWPERFVFRAAHEPYDVARAVLLEGGQPVLAVTVSAFPLAGRKVAADEFAEQMTAEMDANLAVRHLEVLKKTPMRVAGLEAAARLLSYTFRGEEVFAARVYWIRPLTDPEVELSYAVTVEATAKRRSELLPVLGEVIKTVRLFPLSHPSPEGIETFTEPVVDRLAGYSIRPPLGWYVQQGPGETAIGQMDYLRGGLLAVSAQVLVREHPQPITATEHIEQCIEVAAETAAKVGLDGHLVSKGPAKLAGRAGRQFVFYQAPKAQAPATCPAAGSAPASGPAAGPEEKGVVIVQRTVCLPAGDEKTKSYSLVVVCQGDDVEAANAFAEKLAAGVRLLDAPAPETLPSSPEAPQESQ